MKRLGRVFGLMVAMAVLLPFRAVAGSFAFSPACQLGTLAGGYSFTLNGSDGSAPRYTPFASVVLINFNGKGKFTGGGPRSSGGTVEESTLDGTYTVNADCSADFSWDTYVAGTLIDTTIANGVIVANGNGAHLLIISDTLGPLTVSGAFEKAGYY
jgi:hypothetical protein